MTGIPFMYCPRCGGTQVSYLHDRNWFCSGCGFTLFNNVASAVGVIIAAGTNRVLFEKRAREPRRGYLAVPGGFTDPDETLEEAAVRECMEETGIAPSAVRYLCSFPNTYEYKGVVYKTCDSFFSASLPNAASECELSGLLKAERSEVSGFVFESVACLDDISRLPLAFPSAEKALAEWLKNRV